MEQILVGDQYEVSRSTSIWTPDYSKVYRHAIERAEILGEGAHGKVMSFSTGLVVKIIHTRKTINKSNSLDERRINIALTEAAFLQRCNYETIVEVMTIGVFEATDDFYIVMPRARGDAISQSFLMDHVTRVSVCYDITRAVAYLHSRNILHRDIKPGNVLIYKNGSAQLSDFGMATYECRTSPSKSIYAYTLWYRPPELLVTHRSDQAAYSYSADIWALGLTVYQILYGRPLVIHDMQCDQIDAHSQRIHPCTQSVLNNLLKIFPFPHSWSYFVSEWNSNAAKPVLNTFPINSRLSDYVTGPNSDNILDYIERSLGFHPDDRSSAKELLKTSLFSRIRRPAIEKSIDSPVTSSKLREAYPIRYPTREEEEERVISFAGFASILVNAPRTFFFATLLYDAIEKDREISSDDHADICMSLAYVFLLPRLSNDITDNKLLRDTLEYARRLNFDLIYNLAFDIFVERELDINDTKGFALMLSYFDTIRFKQLPSTIVDAIDNRSYDPVLSIEDNARRHLVIYMKNGVLRLDQ